MKALLILCLTLTYSAFAQADDRDVVVKARQVTRSLSASQGLLTRQERRQVLRLLNRVLEISEGSDVVNPPPPQPPQPPISRAFYVGHCELDDDKSFDPGQDVIGSIRGSQVMDLLSQCADFAKRRYGSSGSYKVTKIELRGRVSSELYKSECHVDDDRQFDANQNVMGTLVGRDLLGIAQECRELGRFMFRTSSFKLLNNQEPSGRYRARGVCHIDDDVQHDMGQDVFPMVGRAKVDIERDCLDLSRDLYGRNSSFKVVY